MNVTLLAGLLALGAQGPSDAAPDHTPEQLAVGAVREIVSAQAVQKVSSPEVGYACSLEPLVEADLLGEVWLGGRRLDGYVFELWCDTTSTPQTTFRASAVPMEKTEGATMTVCTDETNAVRTIEGDVAACLENGGGR